MCAGLAPSPPGPLSPATREKGGALRLGWVMRLRRRASGIGPSVRRAAVVTAGAFIPAAVLRRPSIGRLPGKLAAGACPVVDGGATFLLASPPHLPLQARRSEPVHRARTHPGRNPRRRVGADRARPGRHRRARRSRAPGAGSNARPPRAAGHAGMVGGQRDGHPGDVDGVGRGAVHRLRRRRRSRLARPPPLTDGAARSLKPRGFRRGSAPHGPPPR